MKQIHIDKTLRTVPGIITNAIKNAVLIITLFLRLEAQKSKAAQAAAELGFLSLVY